jgi:hypothetical protein
MFLYPPASTFPNRMTRVCHVERIALSQVDNVHIEEMMRHCGLLSSKISYIVWRSNKPSRLGYFSGTGNFILKP